jgi:hypothetical protein
MTVDDKMRRAACSDCGAALPSEPVAPCPACGSRRRDAVVYPQPATGVGAALSPEVVAREPDPAYHGGRLRKPARERRVGMSRSSDGIERPRIREYDRMRDTYEETILNPDGSTHHHTAEPLIEHRRPRRR